MAVKIKKRLKRKADVDNPEGVAGASASVASALKEDHQASAKG